jgi:glycosyltransferase involved in cell wall biosynthesis
VIQVCAPASSIGIHNYAVGLVGGLTALGVEAAIFDRPRSRTAHFQLGNSTRSLLPSLVRAKRPALVTLHDVVPRSMTLRRLWPPVVRRLLAGHRVVVHARHSAQMLRDMRVEAAIDVIPHGARERRLDETQRASCRADVSPSGAPIFVAAGVLKRAKHIGEILAASERHPAICFLLVGEPADDDTRRALAMAPPNVVHRSAPTTDAFETFVASADLLLSFRSDWVGEVSGPVTQAHALGTPVAGWTLGSLPEYCGAEDVLFAPTVRIADALAELAHTVTTAGFSRVPATSPSITTWTQAARAHQAIYAELGWL